MNVYGRVIGNFGKAEVISRLSAIGMPEKDTREALSMLGLEIIPFDEEQAYQVGLLYSKGREYGLSLGDRACLALARSASAIAVTADRAWDKLNLGTKIKTIR